MAIAKLENVVNFDLGRKTEPWEKRNADGKKLRKIIPRESHAEWQAPKNRPDPVKTVMINNKGRQPHLIALRMGRNGRVSVRLSARIGLCDGIGSLGHADHGNGHGNGWRCSSE
jgi:hypothetical protein